MKLNEYYGESNVLDLTKRNIIPSRFKKILEKTQLHYGLVLNTKLLSEEYDILTVTSNCKTITELNDASQGTKRSPEFNQEHQA
ncbi:hypothetical protein HPULCUR_004568 [Helicostylum pulchrum]|uniref:Uncharacterized protein n=1 Tax=Helicostylum pulchrum TaxID=562976 RepID=A0ABP9XXJ3_9FUNG